MIDNQIDVRMDEGERFFQRRQSNKKVGNKLINMPISRNTKRKTHSFNTIQNSMRQQEDGTKKQQQSFFTMVMQKLKEKQSSQSDVRRTLKDIRRQNQIIEQHFQKTMLNKNAVKMIQPPEYMRPFKFEKPQDGFQDKLLAIKSGAYDLDNEDMQLNQVIRDIRGGSRNVSKRLSKIGIVNYKKKSNNSLNATQILHHNTADSLGFNAIVGTNDHNRTLDQTSLDRFLLEHPTSRDGDNSGWRNKQQSFNIGKQNTKDSSQLRIPIWQRNDGLKTSHIQQRSKFDKDSLMNQTSLGLVSVIHQQTQQTNRSNNNSVRYPLCFVEIRDIYEKCAEHQRTQRDDQTLIKTNLRNDEEEDEDNKVSKKEMKKIKEQNYNSSILVKKLNGSVGGRKFLESIWKPSKFRLTKKGPQLDLHKFQKYDI